MGSGVLSIASQAAGANAPAATAPSPATAADAQGALALRRGWCCAELALASSMPLPQGCEALRVGEDHVLNTVMSSSAPAAPAATLPLWPWALGKPPHCSGARRLPGEPLPRCTGGLAGSTFSLQLLSASGGRTPGFGKPRTGRPVPGLQASWLCLSLLLPLLPAAAEAASTDCSSTLACPLMSSARLRANCCVDAIADSTLRARRCIASSDARVLLTSARATSNFASSSFV
mmetsp:Transcript_81640/g.141920  ORF Transcript_81640/g.141920 Transcript_81640/m.141920 type:complete len:232 (+) Transcript_81640:145-840(+)